MSLEKIEGIVLKSGRSFEKGKTYTVLSRNHGVINVFGYQSSKASGAHNSVLYPTMLIQMTAYMKKGSIPKIKETSVDFFSSDLIHDIKKMAHINVFFEILLTFLVSPESDEFQKTYLMSRKMVKNFAQQIINYDIIVAYLIKLTYFLGYGLNMTECAVCHKTNDHSEARIYLNFSEHGFVCSECNYFIENKMTLEFTRQDIEFLQKVLYGKLDEINEEFVPIARKKYLRNVLLNYLCQHVGKGLKSFKMLLEIDK